MNNSEGIGKNLIATLSHQLKSPISTIQSLLKTVSDGFTGETNAHTLQFIEKATRKAREANELISDLLNYEAYAGAGKIDKKELDFVDLVRTAAAGLGAEASGRDVSVRLRLPEKTSVMVFGNARGLDIAVSNLMENAIKYTPAGGVVLVKISVTKRNKRCLLEVVDSGYGIAAEEMKNIFTPFYRSVKHKAIVSGTGLGLAITRNIANIHYGDLSASSKEGAGSTFTLALPFLRVLSTPGASSARKRVCIIGGVTAGPKAAARLRRLDETLDITIIERSEFLSYSGCGLPSYISGRVHSPKALMSTADNTIRDINFFESIKGIGILNRTEAVAIDRKKKTVTVRDLAARETRTVPYDVLILATGADSLLPDIPGIRNPGIYSLHRMEDAEAIKNECAAQNARDVFIIGGGLIGIETAESLIEAGSRVTILEKKSHILSNIFDREFSEKIQNALNRKGIKVVTGVRIDKIARKDRRLVFVTDKGKFNADLVVLSTGVRPNSFLAKKAGLALSPVGAIKVDRYLRTSDPAVYAIGDCAESVNFLTKRHEYWPLGSISTKMGRIAADNICGRKMEFAGFIGTTMFQNFDSTFARTGLTMESAVSHGYSAQSVVITGLDRAHYSKNAEYITLKVIADAKTQAMLGGQAYGRGDVVRQIQVIASAITRSMSLSDVFGLDLGYSPLFNNPIDLVQTACLMLGAKLEGLARFTSLAQFNTDKSSLACIDVSPFADHLLHAIPGSVNVPLENLRKEGIPFDKKAKCVLYSKTSSRAYEAYRFLITRGYERISILEGGYLYWAQ